MYELAKTVLQCLGGMSGTDLVILPNEGGLLDQPAYFVQAHSIIVAEIARYRKELEQKAKQDANKSNR